jgi:hypothetical protein
MRLDFVRSSNKPLPRLLEWGSLARLPASIRKSILARTIACSPSGNRRIFPRLDSSLGNRDSFPVAMSSVTLQNCNVSVKSTHRRPASTFGAFPKRGSVTFEARSQSTLRLSFIFFKILLLICQRKQVKSSTRDYRIFSRYLPGSWFYAYRRYLFALGSH